MRLSIPTTRENVTARLFLRFFICYLTGILLIVPVFARRGIALPMERIGGVQCAFLFLAEFAAFVTVSGPFLLLLTFGKATLDAMLLCYARTITKGGLRTVVPCNALFCYLVCTLLLFCGIAAFSSVFAHEARERDTRLLFSRRCLTLMSKLTVCSVFAWLLYRIWPYVTALFPSI